MQFYGVNDPNGQLLAVAYEPVDGILTIRWKKGFGQHSGVPDNEFLKLRRARYAYRQYTLTIKGKFPYTKLESIDEEPNIAEEFGRCSGRVDERSSRNGEFGVGSPKVWMGERPRNNQVQESNQESKGGRIVEIFYHQDGVEFHDTDANGNPAHFYTLNGQRIPFSLTGILETAGLARKPQSAQEAEAWAKKAALGTKVHEYSLWLDQGELELVDLKEYPAYHNRVLGWQQFKEDFKFMPDLTSCEVPMVVKLNGMMYAMKLDKYGAIGDEDNTCMAVVEVKCSAQFEKSYPIQTAGQAIAFKEQAAQNNLPLKRYCVKLLEEPNQANRYYNVEEHTDRMDDKVFVAALMLCYYRQQHGLL